MFLLVCCCFVGFCVVVDWLGPLEVFSGGEYPKMRRINRLASKGRLVALLVLRKKRTLEKTRFSPERLRG